MKHWRLKTWTGDPRSKNSCNGTRHIYVSEYCLKNHVGAMGWCLQELRPKIQSGSITVNDMSDYKRLVRQTEPREWTDHILKSVYYLDPTSSKGVKPDDLIWLYDKRADGDNDSDYYIARVEKDSEYHYNPDDEAYDNDACNQLTNLHWLIVGKASIVHDGVVQVLRLRGVTFCPMYSYEGRSFPCEYSKSVYNKITGTNYYKL